MTVVDVEAKTLRDDGSIIGATAAQAEGQAGAGKQASPDQWATAPRLVKIHRMLAAALAEAARTMGQALSFDAVLSRLTDGRDDLKQIDIHGVMQAAENAGLVVEVAPRPTRLGSATLILVDPQAPSGQEVLLFPKTELGDENRAMRFHPAGLRQPFRYQEMPAQSDDSVWLSIDRMPFAPQGRQSLRDRLPDPSKMAWLWDVLKHEKQPLRYALLASLAITVLGLIMPLFSMVLFNTVAPNGATATLVALAIGMFLATVADFVLKELRAHVVDIAARRIDMVLSRRTFEHLLDVRLESWRGSAGTQADMLRGYSTVQEVFTSSVLLLFIDMPFGLVAVAMTFVVGGHLGWVPAFWAVVMLAVTWRMQASIERTTKLSMRLGQERHGTLVEAINTLEGVRAVGGERVLRRRWRDQSAMSAMAAGSNRMLSSLVASSSGLMMQFQSLMLLSVGAYMVGTGHLSLGGLIAANMLAARALGPFMQVVGLGMRLESARVAAGYMSRFFQLPRMTRTDRELVARNDYQGAITLDDVSFTYPSTAGVRDTIGAVSLRIEAGERVAILGRMGSGKSTLLKIIAGVLSPAKGRVLLDGTDSAQLDVVTRRSIVGYLQQDPALISGSLRENIALGRPDASDAEILHASRLAGVDGFAQTHPDGYSMRIDEGGRGLSQGQKQAVGLSQILLNGTKALLLDEPSSSFDMEAESRLIQTLSEPLAGRTLLVVTHRPAFLQLVDRVVVVDAGRVVMDGPRDEVLRALSQPAHPSGLTTAGAAR